jgi:hypothetical protein
MCLLVQVSFGKAAAAWWFKATKGALVVDMDRNGY